MSSQYTKASDVKNILRKLNGELFQKIGSIIKTSIQNNCSNLMEIVTIEEESGR